MFQLPDLSCVVEGNTFQLPDISCHIITMINPIYYFMKLYSKPLVDLIPFSIPQVTGTVAAAFYVPCGITRALEGKVTPP